MKSVTVVCSLAEIYCNQLLIYFNYEIIVQEPLAIARNPIVSCNVAVLYIYILQVIARLYIPLAFVCFIIVPYGI